MERARREKRESVWMKMRETPREIIIYVNV